MRPNVCERLWGALASTGLLLSVGCSSVVSDPSEVLLREAATVSQQLTIRDQNRSIELTRDDRVRKLLQAFQKQNPKAEEVMQKVASYLGYGHLTVDAHFIIYHERKGSVKTPVNMDLLVAYLENMYAQQDRQKMPAYIPPSKI